MVVRDTSRIAIEQLRGLKQIGPNQNAILAIIDECGPISDKAILFKLRLGEGKKSRHERRDTGWAINMVTGRRRELVEMGLVVSCGKFTANWQRLPVHLWRPRAEIRATPSGGAVYEEKPQTKEQLANSRRRRLRTIDASTAGLVAREYKRVGRRKTTEPTSQGVLFA